MVPCVNDAASDMLSFGCRLFRVGSFSDIDGELGLGSMQIDISG